MTKSKTWHCSRCGNIVLRKINKGKARYYCDICEISDIDELEIPRMTTSKDKRIILFIKDLRVFDTMALLCTMNKIKLELLKRKQQLESKNGRL